MVLRTSLVFLLVLSITLQQSASYRTVCYYGSWSVYRSGFGKFTVEDIDPFVCTHLIFTFVGLNTDGTVRILDPWNDVGDEWHEGAFTKLKKLRTTNPELKITAAIGGWNEGSKKYSDVASNPALRSKLVNSITELVKQNEFDGFDLDWEYPTQRGGSPVDRNSFSALVKELKERFQKEKLILSAAVSANPSIIDEAYDVPVLSKYLDFINVMTYDIHGSWDKRSGHNAPLYQGEHDAEWYDVALGIDDAIRHWIEKGSDPQKLNLGVASYGRSFTLQSADSHGVGAPATGPGLAGHFVNEAGFLSYNEICYEQTRNLWNTYWDEVGRVPYAVKGTQWVSYDDPQSLTEKVNYAKSFGLGGIMMWSIETDDFANICGKGKYVLLNTINSVLRDGSKPPVQPPQRPTPSTTVATEVPITTSRSTTTSVISSTTTSKPITTTSATQPAPSTPVDGDLSSRCTADGEFFRDSRECSKFYKCQQLEPGNFEIFTFNCSYGLYFDAVLNICNYSELVEC